MSLLTRLFSHLDWADRRALDTLRATPEPEGVRRLAHVLAAEHVWLARLRGATPAIAVWPELSLDECDRLAAENRAGYAAYLAALGPDDAAREIDYVTTTGQRFRSRIEDVLAHVALHGQYHRGQIALLARAAGGAPAASDYIAFAREAPAG